MPFTLRSYQSGLVDRAEPIMFAGGVPAVVAPTGAGKTVIMAEAARRAVARGAQVVAVAHRDEIIQQIVKSIRAHLPTRTTIEVVRAGSRTPLRSQVIVGMVPTLSRRLDRLRHLQGCTLLQDECHHAGAKSWENVTETLAPRYRMGFTATPIRPNGKGLGDEGGFTELVIGPQPGELMAMGALCRYRMFATPQQIDADGIRKMSTGDYSIEDLERKVKEINGDIVRDWRRFNPHGHRTIFVGVSVAHAHQVAALYCADGIAAEAVDGKSPKAVRAAIFDRFRRGVTTVLCACAVVDEGLDVPEATVLQLTRLTASTRLYRQLCGRVLRPSEGKDVAIIIDHTTNWLELDPPDASIKWELKQEKIEVEEIRVAKVNPEDGEVILIEAPQPVETEVVGNGQEMVEITDAMLAKARPNVARKILNERAMLAVRQVVEGALPPTVLRQWVDMTAILDDDVIHALERPAGMPTGWAAGQVMLNMIQSPKQRDAATAKWQGA
jgi:superfamily II DNA or RNA helicase